MKKLFVALLSSVALVPAVFGQELQTSDPRTDRAFALAVRTLYGNVRDSVIHAGGTYGGEWTRDAAINAWNGANLLMPEIARFSLWNVTTDGRSQVGHQYWDRIIWVLGAWDHYLTTGDRAFLRQACVASANTMCRLEREAFDPRYGLFTGPSVFNDGIAGYDEPIYEPGINSSYVLDYPNSKPIKCLSTNCVYYRAYQLLAEMTCRVGDPAAAAEYRARARVLRDSIRRHLYDRERHKFNYLVDGEGRVHPQQEGLGVAFAVLFGVVDREEAAAIVSDVYEGPFGLPSIWPAFARFSKEKPGRHNVLVWPFVNAFWAEACLHCGSPERFCTELRIVRDLALNSDACFYEIYDMYTGRVCGGWQSGDNPDEWASVHDQTWSATGFIRMILRGMLGIRCREEGVTFHPDPTVLRMLGFEKLLGLPYRNGTFDIVLSGDGPTLTAVRIDGVSFEPGKARIPGDHAGHAVVEFVLGEL